MIQQLHIPPGPTSRFGVLARLSDCKRKCFIGYRWPGLFTYEPPFGSFSNSLTDTNLLRNLARAYAWVADQFGVTCEEPEWDYEIAHNSAWITYQGRVVNRLPDTFWTSEVNPADGGTARVLARLLDEMADALTLQRALPPFPTAEVGQVIVA
jgi:hypothetical protein